MSDERIWEEDIDWRARALAAEARLATATEAAEAARSQLAAAEKIVHLVRTFNCCDGDDAHQTAECAAAINEYDDAETLRAAKEGR